MSAARSDRAADVRAADVRAALAGAAAEIAAAGCATPRLDAELLLAHVLAVPRERLLVEPDRALGEAQLRAFEEVVRRRAGEREPVAYIVGRRAFRELDLAVDRRALVPRPETELLVEAALELAPGLSVLDVGTGCGAVALALADERPDLLIAGSDLSEEALALARANGQRLGLPVRWLHADLLAGIADDYDAILANLPYVAEPERDLLAPEITRHEPSWALFAGGDGLDAIRALLELVRGRARVRTIALEVGAGQAPAVGELIERAGLRAAAPRRDLAGIERVVMGHRV
jgi:release factor glutamine methyltransferase